MTAEDHDADLSRATFTDKDGARERVWSALAEQRAAAFPFPVQGRIPNFKGAREAAARLLEHPAIARAGRIKVNPDSPQRPFREGALRRGIRLLVPTPKLAGGFRELDPAQIPEASIGEAATIEGARHWGRPVSLADLPRVDAVVSGSVAVTMAGRRCGKGHGYGDLEYALLRHLGHPAVPVLTSVHPLQVVGDFPGDAHDLPVSVIVTPEHTYEIDQPPPGPAGIDWTLLDEAALEAMPVLRELKGMDAG